MQPARHKHRSRELEFSPSFDFGFAETGQLAGISVICLFDQIPLVSWHFQRCKPVTADMTGLISDIKDASERAKTEEEKGKE